MMDIINGSRHDEATTPRQAGAHAMVKVSADRKAAHRVAILDAAARLLRERGPEGLSVAEATAAAGLTHGGFYRHFASKSELIAEALRHAMAPAVARVGRKAREGRLDVFAERYLSEAHLNDAGGGCPLAALAADMPRQPPETRAAFAEGLRAFLDAAAAEGDAADAAAELSRLLGALVLARAVASEDPALARTLLVAGRPAEGRDRSAPSR